jgi:hypothetical protein
MNFYASSVALLWTTAMRLGRPRAEVREAGVAERVAAGARPMSGKGVGLISVLGVPMEREGFS